MIDVTPIEMPATEGIEVTLDGPIENLAQNNRPQQPQLPQRSLTQFQRSLIKTAIACAALGEAYSFTAQTFRTACDTEINELNDCDFNSGVFESVAKDPDTHIGGLMMGIAMSSAAIGLRLIANYFRSNRILSSLEIKPSEKNRWREAFDIQAISKEQAHEMYQEMLEQQTEESGQSAESVETLLNSLHLTK